MNIKKITPSANGYPSLLSQIPSPPKQLYCLGKHLEELEGKPTIAIIGSRNVSPYGRHVTEELASGLARNGLVIVSGLAMGVDGIAHHATVEAGGTAIAVLPCGLDRIYPATNHNLAKSILAHGGTIVSEYPKNTDPRRENFVARNRIISGLSLAVLITEAAERSGSLHTANFALEQGREVLAVPGNITSQTSVGTNNLIKTGATPVTCVEDVLQALKIEALDPSKKEIEAATEEEHAIIILLKKGIIDGDELLARSELKPAIFNQTLTMMEITGKVKPGGNGTWLIL